MSLFDELKRRNVFRVGIAYVVSAWVIAQVAELVLDSIKAPDWVMQTLLMVLGLGFVVSVIIAWAYELTPEGIKKEKDVVRDESITNMTAKKLDVITLLAVAVVLVLFAYQKLMPATGDDAIAAAQVASGADGTQIARSSDGTQDGATSAANTASGVSSKSIAVLPFVNMSSDPEQEYFSDGISEEILNSLAKVKQLKVAGRTSSFAFKGRNDDLRLIGDTLGVAHILEGSVRKSGDTVRITAQLIKVDDGFHLWSETYDKKLINIFAIQDEIAAAILVELKTHLLASDVQSIASTKTDPAVYGLYLKAKQYIYTRDAQQMKLALGLLDEAIAKDKSYAPAYAQRAIVTLLLADSGSSYGDIPVAEAKRTSKQMVDAALSIDANLDEALAALGLYHFYPPVNYPEVVKALRRALEINPNLINASNWLSLALDASGDPAGASQVYEHMREIDPLYPPLVTNLAYSYYIFGKFDKADEWIATAARLITDDSYFAIDRTIALGYSVKGKPELALPMFDKILVSRPTDGAVHGFRGFALMQLNDFERLSREGRRNQRVVGHYLSGRIDEAFSLAREADAAGDFYPLLQLYYLNAQDDDFNKAINTRWPTIAALEQAYPLDLDGYGMLLMAAAVAKRDGDQARFEKLMAIIKTTHERLHRQGITSPYFLVNRMRYFALADDTDAAVDMLAKANAVNAHDRVPLITMYPELESIADDPRFLAEQERMRKSINVSRKAVGLAPI